MKARARAAVAATFVVSALFVTAATQGAPPISEAGAICPPGYHVESGGDLEVCVKDKPQVTLAGRAMDRTCDPDACQEAPLQGVSVSATSRGAAPVEGTTGADGRWSVEVPANRSWKVTPTSQGRSFHPASRTVAVGRRDVSNLNFETCKLTGAAARRGVRSAATRKGSPCDPDGLDWSMPQRLTLETPEKHFTDLGLPNRAFLDPKTWDVELFLTRDGKEFPPACKTPAGVRWRWVVKPRDKKAVVKGKVRDGCRTRLEVTRLGDYDVTAVKERRVGDGWDKELTLGPEKVTVDDIILVGVGDSSASGEGNFPFYFEACDRSVKAYQFQAALHVEQRDPRTSVTFMHPACSGARLDHMWKNAFDGTHGTTKLPPQLNQIAKRLGRVNRDPKVDALIGGIGVNDLAFGPVLAYCIPRYEGEETVFCRDQNVITVKKDGHITQFKRDEDAGKPLADWIANLASGLGPKYADFLRRVQAKRAKGGLELRKPARILLSQYPNFSRGESGPCDTRNRGMLYLPRWGPETWGWMGDSAELLSAIIRNNSGSLGYTPIPLEQTAFYGRGYCIEDGTSLFVGLQESANNQGNVNGAFHPNAVGHGIMAEPTKVKLCEALYGNPTCEGRFRG